MGPTVIAGRHADVEGGHRDAKMVAWLQRKHVPWILAAYDGLEPCAVGLSARCAIGLSARCDPQALPQACPRAGLTPGHTRTPDHQRSDTFRHNLR